MAGRSRGTGNSALDRTLELLGYAFDPDWNIFYSTLNTWQRNFGYCRLYDEAAALFSMIIDCEPVHFNYCGKRWLIQFWKGQYAVTTGCEAGVYYTDQPDVHIPGFFTGPFFNAAGNQDLLHISYSLLKNDRLMFIREDVHWWLTGFILGEFSEPHELIMDIEVTLKDRVMRNAFVRGLKEAGYRDHEIRIHKNRVGLLFDRPRTPQPSTRTPDSDRVIQRINEALCSIYQNITGNLDSIAAKIEKVREESPDLYAKVISIGKNRELFNSYDLLLTYLT